MADQPSIKQRPDKESTFSTMVLWMSLRKNTSYAHKKVQVVNVHVCCPILVHTHHTSSGHLASSQCLVLHAVDYFDQCQTFCLLHRGSKVITWLCR